MPCSQRKIEANRRNAQKSTGPRTAEGKARSSRNAVSHGLTADLTPVVLDESQGEFDAFAQELADDLRPTGAMQRMIVDRIILVSWKLRRIPKIERSIFSSRDERVAYPPAHPDVPPEEAAQLRAVLWGEPEIDENEPTGSVGDAMLAQERQVRFIQLYEMRLERSLHASLRELTRLKKLKNEATEDEIEPAVERAVATEDAGALRQTSAMRATPPDAKSEDFKNSVEPGRDASAQRVGERIMTQLS